VSTTWLASFYYFCCFSNDSTAPLYCCIWNGWMTEICFIMWFICIYTCMIHLFRYVLHPHIRFMKNLFHYKYPYVKFLFIMCFIHRYPYMKHVSLYVPIHATRVSLCASSTDTRIWNMFNFFFIHRYLYMKHLCVLQSYMKHVSFCASSTQTRTWNMFHYVLMRVWNRPCTKQFCLLLTGLAETTGREMNVRKLRYVYRRR